MHRRFTRSRSLRQVLRCGRNCGADGTQAEPKPGCIKNPPRRLLAEPDFHGSQNNLNLMKWRLPSGKSDNGSAASERAFLICSPPQNPSSCSPKPWVAYGRIQSNHREIDDLLQAHTKPPPLRPTHFPMLIPTSTRATFLRQSLAFPDRILLDRKECERLFPASRYQAGAFQLSFLCWFRHQSTPPGRAPHQIHFCPQLLKPSKQPCGGSLANWTIWLKSSNH